MLMKRFLKPGWLIIYVIIIFVFFGTILGWGKMDLDHTVSLEEGQSLSSLYTEFDLSWEEMLHLKRYLKKHNDEVMSIQPWSYVFSGSYSAAAFLDTFLAGPVTVYKHVTILEWWSIYDVDASLTEQGLIEGGEYIAMVTDAEIISPYIERYDFLAQAKQERPELSSLEWYLYPDTYYIDKDHDFMDDLVYLQLEAFQKKIWDPYGEQLKSMTVRLAQRWFTFSLSSYGSLILASIVEKEERVQANKPVITSIFFNRLQDGMQIDADISLCYWLAKGYEHCSPKVIVENLYDKNNPYNTRAVWWLPPTPISNISVGSVQALLEAGKSWNYFYLHDSQGRIHVGRTISEHNANKSTYLR